MQNNANEMAVYNTAIYVRLSKEDIVAAQSGRESNSITNQKQLILDFLKDKPEFNIVSIRIDDGYTGTNFDRPAFQRMLNDIKAGRINCVVVKDLSRFGREYINSGKYIHRLFPVLGVRLIAINDNIDTITRDESSEFSITLKNLMNDNYSRDISVKVRSQLQVKRKHGDFNTNMTRRLQSRKAELYEQYRAGRISREKFADIQKTDSEKLARLSSRAEEIKRLLVEHYESRGNLAAGKRTADQIILLKDYDPEIIRNFVERVRVYPSGEIEIDMRTSSGFEFVTAS